MKAEAKKRVCAVKQLLPKHLVKNLVLLNLTKAARFRCRASDISDSVCTDWEQLVLEVHAPVKNNRAIATSLKTTFFNKLSPVKEVAENRYYIF